MQKYYSKTTNHLWQIELCGCCCVLVHEIHITRTMSLIPQNIHLITNVDGYCEEKQSWERNKPYKLTIGWKKLELRYKDEEEEDTQNHTQKADIGRTKKNLFSFADSVSSLSSVAFSLYNATIFKAAVSDRINFFVTRTHTDTYSTITVVHSSHTWICIIFCVFCARVWVHKHNNQYTRTRTHSTTVVSWAAFKAFASLRC